MPMSGAAKAYGHTKISTFHEQYSAAHRQNYMVTTLHTGNGWLTLQACHFMSRTLPLQHLAPNFGSCSPGAALLPLHPWPPCAACRAIPRLRTCDPPPQPLEHLEILTEGMTTSTTRNDGGRLHKNTKVLTEIQAKND